MIDTFQDHLRFPTAIARSQGVRLTQNLWLLGLLGLSAALGLFMFLFGPSTNLIAWLLFILGIVGIVRQPRHGLYLILFLSLIGDGFLSYWYPFNKNFSSPESIMYLNGALIFSPLETYMVLTLLVLIVPGILQHKLNLYTSKLFWVSISFIAFVVFGMVWGIARGGSLNIGLWEARPIFYIPVMLFLANNLLTRPEHISRILWLAMLALFFEGLNGAYYYFATLNADLTGIESLTEHSAAIHMNTFIVLMVAVWLYKGSYYKRLLLPLMAFPLILTYIITQRRAAFISLFVALILMGLMLFWENRKLFFFALPLVGVVAVLYIGIFWNSGSALALPVQAIKSVLAPEQVSLQDQLSNLYRVLENVNAHYNIRQKPFTGIGFGQKLAFIVPLPDISFFVWWEYIIHNSVMWIWIKTGIGGFLTMLFLIGLSIFQGMRVVMRLPSSDMSAMVLTAVLYVIMHFIYAYVDMSWDNQSMVYLGTMMGLISVVERVIALYVPLPQKRWPWQKEVKPALYLRPLKYESAA